MVMPWDYIRGLLGRDSKEKRVVRYQSRSIQPKDRTNLLKLGSKLDIDMRPRHDEDSQPWRPVEEVAYIPTNERDLLRQDIAEEMGLNTRPGAAVDVCWKLAHGTIPYIYSNSFWIKEDMPCKVIFGKQLALNSIQGYPHPFERATRYEFDRSYNSSKTRTNSWGGRLKKKTLSWGSLGSFERKDNSRRESLLQRKSPVQPLTSASAAIQPVLPTTGNLARPKDFGTSVKVETAMNDPKSQIDHSASSGTAELINEPSGLEKEGHGESRLSDPPELKPENECDSAPGSCERRELGLKPINTQYLKEQQAALVTVHSVVGENSKSDAIHCAVPERQHNVPVHSASFATSRGSDGMEVTQEQSTLITSEFGEKPGLSIRTIVEAQPSWVGTETRSILARPREEGFPSSEQGEAYARNPQQWMVSELENKTDMASEPSTIYAESSLNTGFDPSTAPESPTSHGNFTSYGMERFPTKSGLDDIRGRDMPPEVANASINPAIQQDARSKIRARKRGKAPRIRSAKLDDTKASQTVDLTPAPGADEEWTYDPQAKGFYQINSDTGSRFWYDDSEAENSEE